MKRKIIIALAALSILIIIFFAFGSTEKDKAAPQYVKVANGLFEVLVAVTGELKAQNSEDIEAPSELRGRSFRISDVKIQDLIPEGTVVDSGAYVATLDRSALSNRLKEIEDDLEKSQQGYLKTQLDTTLTLRELRNTLVNLKFDMEEKQIVVDQSKFEPPATQRQAQINLDKSGRSYSQALYNYTLKREQAEASMKEVGINLAKQKREKQDMMSILSKFVILAPKPGMVIYYREWSGQKRKVGSTVSPWDLTVATLPDLSIMNSKTYVNEIDISKVKKGQIVRIGIDAFPEKKYSGEVIEVANIGEQLPNTDAKVFEVAIRVNGYDPILRPSMTTSNQIVTSVFDSVQYLPLEAIHADDSLSYVYTKKGKKQIVVTGEMNENFIIIEKGLSSNEEVYLSIPEKVEKFDLAGNELIPIIKEKEKNKKLDEEKRKAEQEMQMKPKNGDLSIMNKGDIQEKRGPQNFDKNKKEKGNLKESNKKDKESKEKPTEKRDTTKKAPDKSNIQ